MTALLAAGGPWEDVVDLLGGVLYAVVAIVAVLGVGGVWIALWSLWRTRGNASQS